MGSRRGGCWIGWIVCRGRSSRLDLVCFVYVFLGGRDDFSEEMRLRDWGKEGGERERANDAKEGKGRRRKESSSSRQKRASFSASSCLFCLLFQYLVLE